MRNRWSSEDVGRARAVLAWLAVGLAVLGIERWGNMSPAAAQQALRICFEAEDTSRVTPPFQVVHKKLKDIVRQTNSGAGYIEIPDKANGDEHDERNLKGEATYQVKVPRAGAYVIWLRVMWQDGCGNSCRLGVGNSSPWLVGEEATYQKWQWQTASKLKSATPLRLQLEAGVTVLRLLNREDGIKIDQVFITDDARFVPVGAMPVTPGALVQDA